MMESKSKMWREGSVDFTEEEDDSESNIKVTWTLPERLDFMTFIGKDVIAIAHDIYITFLNFKNHTELVYTADGEEHGDGVDVIAGHRSTLFAFTEKTKNGRILILNYPSFNILEELKDTEVNRYKGLCMMESDLVAGFSGFPNYLITVWSWRTRHRLLALPTNVIKRNQIYMASRSHMLICECWGDGLIVWEAAQCYKKCLMMKRAKEEKTGWEISESPLVGVCWSNDGQLYAVDPQGHLYSVLSDGIGMVTNLEWDDVITGNLKTCICSFGNGLLIYGPDNCLRSLKKCESKWKVAWSYTPRDEVVRLISNFSSDVASIWTVRGFVYRLLAHPDSDEVDVSLFTYKQRNIQKIQFIAPNFDHIATIDAAGVVCVYEIANAKLALMKFVQGNDISIVASPVDPILIVFGEVGHNYGMALELFQDENLQRVENYCLTHQIVSQVMFSPSGREVVAAAMSAGHIFIFGLSTEYQLTLVRYTEIGRGLADCFLMKVGEFMRCFSLVLFSDKYLIGERIVCINAESGKDNKFAGKMQGPYSRLVATGARDRVVAIPRPSMHYHVLQLSADKGVTVSVKVAAIINAGHDIKQFDGFYNAGAFLTFGFDGQVIIRKPEAPEDYEVKVVTSHRYESGLRQAISEDRNKWLSHLSRNRTVTLRSLRGRPRDLRHVALSDELLDRSLNLLYIFSETDKNYLDIQEEKKVHEEALDCMKQREEVVRNFEEIRAKLVELLEENLLEPPLHQLSLAEFDLHLEHKRERMKQAEKEREEIRLKTEARIRAQDKVTAWIKSYCWDKMLTPRVKLFAIFSHYQVENYPVLPTQRDMWPELQLTEAIRTLEMDNNEDVFRPWEEIQSKEVLPGKEQSQEIPTEVAAEGSQTSVMVQDSRTMEQDGMMSEELVKLNPYSLSGTNAHRLVDIPPFMIPQTLAFSFMQMNWLQHIVKLNVQNLRLWFNKQFDDLMNLKKREVGLVEERNARLRFIIEELNKLSDLRGSFHHLMIMIKDPEWRQEEQPQRLIKVEPAECSIEPYISPSQIVIVPPDPGPKDDFRERALIEMMDGVLEKLWHEEIKKPIPKPQCMLDKEPEHFNEDDLRLVFEYEKKVAFRNEERDKYRKMLHAEYAKLSQLLNDGVVKFNQKVKEAWLMKLRVDSVIGQENLNLMRLRRVNLDRVETAERVETIREQTAKLEAEVEMLTEELKMVHDQNEECQTVYDSLAQKDKLMDRTFKNHFADLSQIIVDQCYKYFKRRPKWQARATMTPVVLNELAVGVASGVRPPMLHPDCNDYFKGMEQLDQISNMPAVMDEGLWNTMCKLRRAKTDIEIKMRAIVAESAFVESAGAVWSKALQARRAALQALASELHNLREDTELKARNKTVQLVLPAGQVEILTTGHIEDFEDATLILREDIEKVNEVILKVGDMKLRMMRKQMDFRKGILSKEWEHAQMKMKLRHMEQELYSYKRLKIPKELQMYLKKKEKGYNDEMDYVRMEREMAATRASFNRNLQQEIQRVEEIQVKVNAIEDATNRLEKLIVDLNVKVSEKRLKEDPLEPIRIRRIFKKRMETLVARSKLIREVQQNHINIVLLQTELELLRLKTYPTLASFRTLS